MGRKVLKKMPVEEKLLLEIDLFIEGEIRLEIAENMYRNHRAVFWKSAKDWKIRGMYYSQSSHRSSLYCTRCTVNTMQYKFGNCGLD